MPCLLRSPNGTCSLRVEASIDVSIEPIEDLARLGDEWNDLTERADTSFFTSWGWIGCWLRALPREVKPQLLRVQHDRRTVGLAVVVPRTIRRLGFLTSRALHLQETGVPRFDRLMIEHNGLVTDRQVANEVHAALLAYLEDEQSEWEECFLGGIASSEGDWIARSTSLTHTTRIRLAWNFVDLEAVRESGGDYLQQLSSNKRQQIRRSLRLYEEAHGALVLDHARTVEEALEFFGTMRLFHQEYWTAKGEPGAFHGEFVNRFHEALIRSCFEDGSIQLARIGHQRCATGFLYNFVHEGHVHNYQSGFKYDDDPRLKPGLVGHTLAIQDAIANGHRVYDFLAGGERYKKSLGNRSGQMAWYVLRKPRVKFKIEKALTSTKHALRSALRPSTE